MKTFTLSHDEAKANALAYLAKIPADGKTEVVIRPAKTGKTLSQLGALFGLWIAYLSNELGEDEDYLHRMLKAKFLARIYITNPIGSLQEMWVERLADVQQSGDQEKLMKHAKRISLSWATKEQMNMYMTAVQNYYASNGYPLPVPDRFSRVFR